MIRFFFCTGDFLTTERFVGFCSSFELDCKQKSIYFLVIEPFVDRVAGVELDSKQRFSTVGFSEHGVEIFNFLCSCEINLSIAATSHILFSCATPNSTVISLLESLKLNLFQVLSLLAKNDF